MVPTYLLNYRKTWANAPITREESSTRRQRNTSTMGLVCGAEHSCKVIKRCSKTDVYYNGLLLALAILEYLNWHILMIY